LPPGTDAHPPVYVRRLPDGQVAVTCNGQTGVGKDAAEAVLNLPSASRPIQRPGDDKAGVTPSPG
jgi:hypothetical protein